jgi:hypothetical protein
MFMVGPQLEMSALEAGAEVVDTVPEKEFPEAESFGDRRFKDIRLDNRNLMKGFDQMDIQKKWCNQPCSH